MKIKKIIILVLFILCIISFKSSSILAESSFLIVDNEVEIDKDGYGGSLVFKYMCNEQGIYEVGEVSKENCKNDYPYAMALKRCFDRVVLKNSKIAYAGIYSDSESDEFIQRNESVENNVKEDFITEKQMKVIEYYYRDKNLEKLLKNNDIEQLEDLPKTKATEIITNKEDEINNLVLNEKLENNFLESKISFLFLFLLSIFIHE